MMRGGYPGLLADYTAALLEAGIIDEAQFTAALQKLDSIPPTAALGARAAAQETRIAAERGR